MRGGGLVVEQRAIGDGDDAGVGVDGEASAGGIIEAVADRIGAVRIGGQGGHTDSRAVGGVLGHGVRRGIAIRDRADVELIDVREIDGEGLGRGRAVGARGLDDHRMGSGVLVVEQRTVGDGDHTGVGIDGKASAGGVVEGVGHRVGAVGIGGQSGHTDRSAVGGVLGDRVGSSIAVRDGADIGLVGIAQIDREGLGRGRAIRAGRLDRNRVRSGGLVVQQRGVCHCDDAGVGIDREASTGGIVEGVADRVGAIGVGGQGGHTDSRAVSRILGDRVGGAVIVGDRTDVELIDIREIDREGLSRGRTIAGRRLDSHRVVGGVLVVEQRTVGDGDHTRVGIDGKASAGVVIEAVADRVRCVGISRQSRDANGGSVSGILRDRVGAAVVVRDRADVGLVGIAQIDGEGLGAGRAVGAGRLDGHRVRGRSLVVEQRAVGDGDDTGVGIDGKPATSGVVEGVGDRVGTVGIGGQGGHTDGGAIGGVLGNRVCGAVVVGDGADIELIDIREIDGEGLSRGRTIAGRRLDSHRVVGGVLVVEQRAVGDGNHTGVGIDRETSTGGVVEGVGHRVGAVGISRQSRDANSGSVGGVLGNRVGAAVIVGDGADIGLVGIAQVDGECLSAGGTIGASRLDRNRVRGRSLVVEQRGISDGDDASVGIDGEAATGGIIEAVADRVGAVGIGCQGGDAHGRAIGGIFSNRVGGAVAVGDGADVELIDIRKIDGEGLGRGRAVGARRLDRDGVAGRVFVVEQRAVGDGDHTGVGVDREASASGIVEAVADSVRCVCVRRQGGNANSGAIGGILGDGIGSSIAVRDGPDIGLVGVAQIDREGLRAGGAV